MKKYLFLALLIVGGLLGVQSARLRSENVSAAGWSRTRPR